MNEGRDRWEARAREKGTQLDSVLYRGLPEALNRHLDAMHSERVCRDFAPFLSPGSRVLDVGCGFGRLATSLGRQRPDVEIIGLDLSVRFCELFRDRGEFPAVCGTFSRPPFRDRTFDGLIACTVLMYAEPSERGRTMSRLMAALRPGGHAIFIDPGSEFMTLAARALPSSQGTPTQGSWFSQADYNSLGSAGGFRIVARGGFPFFSLALPLLFLLGKSGFPLSTVLRAVGASDRALGRFSRFSIQRWMVVRRD